MSYLKGLTSKDVIVSPLTVHKTFTRNGNPPSFTNSLNTPIEIPGKNVTYITGSSTGSLPLVYNSIKQLYYGNYINSSDGSLNTASLPQYKEDGTGDGAVLNNLYENNISSIHEIRYLPSAEDAAIQVWSAPMDRDWETSELLM